MSDTRNIVFPEKFLTYDFTSQDNCRELADFLLENQTKLIALDTLRNYHPDGFHQLTKWIGQQVTEKYLALLDDINQVTPNPDLFNKSFRLIKSPKDKMQFILGLLTTDCDSRSLALTAQNLNDITNLECIAICLTLEKSDRKLYKSYPTYKSLIIDIENKISATPIEDEQLEDSIDSEEIIIPVITPRTGITYDIRTIALADKDPVNNAITLEQLYFNYPLWNLKKVIKEQKGFPSEVPRCLKCFLTKEILIDPVIAADGGTYERRAIKEYIEKFDITPGHVMQGSNPLIPNIAIKNIIATHYKEALEKAQKKENPALLFSNSTKPKSSTQTTNEITFKI